MRVIILLAIISMLGVRAMADEPGFRVWTADPLVKILPDSQSKATEGVQVDTVRNEYESAQIVVTTSRKIEKLTVKISQPTGPLGTRPTIEARFVGFVPVKKGTPDTPPEHLIVKPPADVPDPLLAARSVSVEKGKNQPIWLTVHVPKTVKSGAYSGAIEVTGDGASVSVPLIVNVHPVTLPDDRTLYVTNWFWMDKIANAHNLKKWDEPFWKMLEVYAGFMADHRQNVVLTPIMELIKRSEDGKGNMTFDFQDFDRWVELFQKAGAIGMIEGSHLGGRSEWEAKDFNASWTGVTPDSQVKQNPSVKVTSEEYRHFLSQFFPALQKHLEEKGWLDNYVQHLCDEPIPANVESYRKLASYIREYAPKLRIIDACMCSELTGSIDIWVPMPPHYESDIKFFQKRQKAGDEIWFYTCLLPKGKYMNRFLDYPLLDVRLLHWINFKYGLTGYLHWGLNFWQGDPFTDFELDWGGGSYLPPGDTHIAYPGRRGLLSSIRLEAMRDGIEDYELLKLLEKKNPKKAREICNSIVKSLTDYSLDPDAFRKARMQLIKGLSK